MAKVVTDATMSCSHLYRHSSKAVLVSQALGKVIDDYAHYVGLNEDCASPHKLSLTGGCVASLAYVHCGFSVCSCSEEQLLVLGFLHG